MNLSRTLSMLESKETGLEFEHFSLKPFLKIGIISSDLGLLYLGCCSSLRSTSELVSFHFKIKGKISKEKDWLILIRQYFLKIVFSEAEDQFDPHHISNGIDSISI